jgi:hypothetical protein
VDQPDATASEPPVASSGLLLGALRSIGVLMDVHVKHAQQEAATDAGRVLSGVILLVGSLVFLLLAIVLGELAAVYAVRHLAGPHTVSWAAALLVVAAADIFVALILVLWARAKLRKPFLAETRTLIKRTVTTLTDK